MDDIVPTRHITSYKDFYIANFVPDHYEKAMAQCREEGDVESAKIIVRARRNQLLESTDCRMSLDRIGLSVPSYTLAGLIEFIRTMVSALTGGWARYRQALRDLPDQPGFPFDVDWPEEPEER